jgi:hypothetical protein
MRKMRGVWLIGHGDVDKLELRTECQDPVPQRPERVCRRTKGRLYFFRAAQVFKACERGIPLSVPHRGQARSCGSCR